MEKFFCQVEEGSSARTSMDNELQSLRLQVQSLQVDLDNSEAVQRDFVKLSQSLQVSRNARLFIS